MTKLIQHITLVICGLAALSACKQQTLEPFASDGCSAFPNGTFAHNELWLQCCVAHDLSYWQGGTYDQRLQADQALKQCVAQVGQQEIAQLMLAGVRVGGTPFLPTSFRWGYGWPYPRGYREPSPEEQQQIQIQLQSQSSETR